MSGGIATPRTLCSVAASQAHHQFDNVSRAQHHMGFGPRGRFDERQSIFPTAPIFSKSGRAFLDDLTSATEARLRYSLIPEEKMHGDRRRWELMRLRAPDAGRLVWAMGKLKWKNAKVRLLKRHLIGGAALAPKLSARQQNIHATASQRASFSCRSGNELVDTRATTTRIGVCGF